MPVFIPFSRSAPLIKNPEVVMSLPSRCSFLILSIPFNARYDAPLSRVVPQKPSPFFFVRLVADLPFLFRLLTLEVLSVL